MGKKSIILDIDVKDGKIGVEVLDKAIKELGSEINQTESDIKAMIKTLKQQKAELIIGSEAYELLTKEINEYEAALKRSTIAVNADTNAKGKNNKANKNMVDKTGLAGAAVTEIGRTISDSNYGLVAMANNISQLSTLFVTLIATTGGVVNGFKALWSAAMGPLGVILIFQGIITYLESLKMNSKKATDELSKLDKVYNDQITSLEEIQIALQKTSLEENERIEILKNLNNEFKDLNVTEDNYKTKLEEKILVLKEEAKARMIISEITKLQNKLIEIELMKSTELIGFWQTAWVGIKNQVKTFGQSTITAEGFLELSEIAKKERKKLLDDTQKDIDRLRKILEDEDLLDNIINNDGQDNNASEARIKDFKSKVLDLEAFIIKSEESLNKILGETRSDRVEAESKAAFDLLDKKKRDYEAQRTLDAEEARKRINDSKLSEEEKSKELKKIDDVLNKDLFDSYEEYLKAKEALNAEYIQRNRIAAEEDAFDELKLRNDVIKKYAETLNSVGEFLDSEFNRQLDIQRAYVTEQNNILREQLNNENLSAEERKRIQLKISQNDEAARKQDEKIKKKQFAVNKAFGIAQATTNTFIAVSETLKNPAIPEPLRIPSAIATGVFGMAQVATIARQKYVPTASSAPTAGALGGSGGSGDRTFDFNLVGESPESQLNRTIQSQFEKPLQAYVVSKDISSQQELDLNIRKSAKI